MTNLNELVEKYPDIELNEGPGADAYKEGVQIVERDPIAVVIKHPSEDSYLIAKWKGITWNGLLTGGIEEGDTLEDTVRKEIHEETGYKHVAEIKPIDYVTHALFYHVGKGVNRLAHYHLVYAKLADLEQNEISEKEKAIADFVWIPRDEVAVVVTNKAMKLLWDFYSRNK